MSSRASAHCNIRKAIQFQNIANCHLSEFINGMEVHGMNGMLMLREEFGEYVATEVNAKRTVCGIGPAPGGMEAFEHIAPAAHVVGIDKGEGLH